MSNFSSLTTGATTLSALASTVLSGALNFADFASQAETLMFSFAGPQFSHHPLSFLKKLEPYRNGLPLLSIPLVFQQMCEAGKRMGSGENFEEMLRDAGIIFNGGLTLTTLTASATKRALPPVFAIGATVFSLAGSVGTAVQSLDHGEGFSWQAWMNIVFGVMGLVNNNRLALETAGPRIRSTPPSDHQDPIKPPTILLRESGGGGEPPKSPKHNALIGFINSFGKPKEVQEAADAALAPHLRVGKIQIVETGEGKREVRVFPDSQPGSQWRRKLGDGRLYLGTHHFGLFDRVSMNDNPPSQVLHEGIVTSPLLDPFLLSRGDPSHHVIKGNVYYPTPRGIFLIGRKRVAEEGLGLQGVRELRKQTEPFFENIHWFTDFGAYLRRSGLPRSSERDHFHTSHHLRAFHFRVGDQVITLYRDTRLAMDGILIEALANGFLLNPDTGNLFQAPLGHPYTTPTTRINPLRALALTPHGMARPWNGNRPGNTRDLPWWNFYQSVIGRYNQRRPLSLAEQIWIERISVRSAEHEDPAFKSLTTISETGDQIWVYD